MSDVEASYVHDVYSRLATYAPSSPHNHVWPAVKKYLDSLDPGSVILDVGCGRSQHTANQCITVGIDTCPDMILKVSRNAQMEVVLANALEIPLRENSMDGVLCVSVLHHLATVERRRKALERIVEVLKTGCQVIIYVWAFEQPNGCFKSQDVLVPFNLHEIAKSGQLPIIKFHKDSTKEERIINNSIPIIVPEETCPRWFKAIFGLRLWKLIPGRYAIIPPAIPSYLQTLSIENVHHKIVSGIQRWSPALSKMLATFPVEEIVARDLSAKIMEESLAEAMSTLGAVSYYRYYHVFRKGEVEALISSIPNLSIVETTFDSGNWCVIAQKESPQNGNIRNITI